MLALVQPVEPVSAIVVRVPVPRALARLRDRWDWAAGVGAPAHVTVLFPFLPVASLDVDVRRELASIAAAHEPFDVRYETIGRFPGIVYAAPEPATPFVRLTDAFAARYPSHPPYGGAHEEVIPHLTIVERQDAPLDAIAAEVSRALPFTHSVTALEVLIEGDDARWRGRWRLPLGVRR